jgi:hypothetical protein
LHSTTIGEDISISCQMQRMISAAAHHQ